MKAALSMAASVALLSTGCTDLDVDVKSQYVSLPQSERAVDAIVGTVYTSMRGGYGRDYWQSQVVSGDQSAVLTMGGGYYDGGRYMQMTLHTWTADNAIIGTVWDEPMNGIMKCNNVLAQIGDEESELAAPIRAMRAFYNFILLDNFGDIPLLRHFGDETPARSSRAEAARYVESELLAVRDLMPTTVDESTYGKSTRWMVDALLAKLYINWAVYMQGDVAAYEPSQANEKLADCVAACDDIISSGLFNLENPYRSRFLPNNGPQIKDFIFVMPYDHLLQRGMHYNRWWNFRNARDMWGFTVPQSVAGVMRMMPAYVDKFNLSGDDRNGVLLGGKVNYWRDYQETSEPYMIKTTLKGLDQYYEGEDADTLWQLELPNELYIRNPSANAANLEIGNDYVGQAMGWRCIKFYVDPATTSADDRSQSNDVPIFRYADILLLKAEALLRGASATDGATAQSLVNEVRRSSHAEELTTEPTLTDILDERARELVDETWRRNDLIRFGEFETPTTLRAEFSPVETAQRFRRVFCIPTGVLNTNTMWQQNPGY